MKELSQSQTFKNSYQITEIEIPDFEEIFDPVKLRREITGEYYIQTDLSNGKSARIYQNDVSIVDLGDNQFLIADKNNSPQFRLITKQ